MYEVLILRLGSEACPRFHAGLRIMTMEEYSPKGVTLTCLLSIPSKNEETDK
jgi:hypothetical protein